MEGVEWSSSGAAENVNSEPDLLVQPQSLTSEKLFGLNGHPFHNLVVCLRRRVEAVLAFKDGTPDEMTMVGMECTLFSLSKTIH